jgi:hypothetical protein
VRAGAKRAAGAEKSEKKGEKEMRPAAIPGEQWGSHPTALRRLLRRHDVQENESTPEPGYLQAAPLM